MASTAAFLARAGHRTQVAYSGLDALRAAEADPPDVLLLDLAMPGLDGYELARRVRSLALPRRPLLLAVSGYCAAQDRKLVRDAGIDGHLDKPAAPELRLRLLRRFGDLL